MFNQKEFKLKIIENDFTVEKLAAVMGINPTTLYRKINERSEFTRTEILEIKKILNLTSTDVNTIFFANQLA